jgi:hypothetical protein
MWSSIGKNAARNGKGIASYVDLPADSLRDLERECVIFWTINREREGLELCKKYMEIVPFGVLPSFVTAAMENRGSSSFMET